MSPRLPVALKRALKSVPGLARLHVAYHHARLRAQSRSLAGKVRRHHQGSADPEIREALEVLADGRARMIPYAWVADYLAREVEVGQEDGLPFARVRGDRVFFPRHYGAAEVRSAVLEALAEQDERSPHRYLHGGAPLGSGDAAVVIGASDGIFALSILPRVRRLWVFEPDPKWAEPLSRTLAGWKEKVEIVHAYVGATAGPGRVSLDEFFAARGDAPTFIQADVEGAELEVLRGARRVIEGAERIALSICTYHRQQDFEVLSRELTGMGCSVAPSRGFLLVHSQVLRPPYLRRAIAYARRGRASG